MREKLIQGYEKSFGVKPEELYFSPGRVNIIGEHIDYNGGKVLPMGISLGIYGAITWRKDTLCRCVSEGFNNEAIYEFDLNGFMLLNVIKLNNFFIISILVVIFIECEMSKSYFNLIRIS